MGGIKYTSILGANQAEIKFDWDLIDFHQLISQPLKASPVIIYH